MKETGHIEIEGAFTAAGLNASNPLHFGRGFEILEVVAFVNEDVVDAQFVKDQAVIFFLRPGGLSAVPRAWPFASQWS